MCQVGDDIVCVRQILNSAQKKTLMHHKSDRLNAQLCIYHHLCDFLVKFFGITVGEVVDNILNGHFFNIYLFLSAVVPRKQS